jgi:hypothetical protein
MSVLELNECVEEQRKGTDGLELYRFAALLCIEVLNLEDGAVSVATGVVLHYMRLSGDILNE